MESETGIRCGYPRCGAFLESRRRLKKADMSLQKYASGTVTGTKQASSRSPVHTPPRSVFKGHRATTPMPPWSPASRCSHCCSLCVDLRVLRETVLRGSQGLPIVVAEFRGMPHGQAYATKHTSSFKFFLVLSRY